MLELNRVSKSFSGTEVLKDISMTIEDGQTTVILGPSGSGKSTLLRLMNLLEVPESGTLHINDDTVKFGGKLSTAGIRSVRKHSAMVFQGYNLFPNQTVLKNVSLPPVLNGKQDRAQAEHRAVEVLNRVGMGDRLNEFPDNLSGGQQQRVAIARALAVDPEYLLFDEPTSALDPELAGEVTSVLVDLAREGRSLVVVTHNVEFARQVAQRVVFLTDGTVEFDGTPEDFFVSDAPRIRRYLNTYGSAQ